MQPRRAAQRAKQGVERVGKQHPKHFLQKSRKPDGLKTTIAIMKRKFSPYTKTSFAIGLESPLFGIIRVSARHKVSESRARRVLSFLSTSGLLSAPSLFDFIGCFPDSSKQPGGGGSVG